MKRYERKSKEEIIDIFNRVLKCENCVLYGDKACECRDGESSECTESVILECIESVIKWLTGDADVKPRFKTLKTEDDFTKFMEDVYKQFCEWVENRSELRSVKASILLIVKLFEKMVFYELTKEVEVTE